MCPSLALHCEPWRAARVAAVAHINTVKFIKTQMNPRLLKELVTTGGLMACAVAVMADYIRRCRS